jgi:hypothetical protein
MNTMGRFYGIGVFDSIALIIDTTIGVDTLNFLLNKHATIHGYRIMADEFSYNGTFDAISVQSDYVAVRPVADPVRRIGSTVRNERARRCTVLGRNAHASRAAGVYFNVVIPSALTRKDIIVP